MPLSSTDVIVASPGSGGASLVVDNFVDPGDGITKTLPFSGICVGTYNGTYEVVGPAASLPVAISDPVDAVQSGDWLVDLCDGAGNAIESAITTPGSVTRGLIVRTVGPNDQGEPAVVADAWPVKISNGTSTATLTTSGGNIALDVNIVDGAGNGSNLDDKGAFTAGTTEMTVVGGIYLATPDTMSDATGGAFRMTSKRALYATLETPAGDSVLNDTWNSVVESSAFPAATTATLSAVGPTASTACSGLGTVAITLSGTCSTMDAVFQLSSDGGTTWSDAYAVRRDTNAFDPGPLGLAMTSETLTWQLDVAGYTHCRLDVTDFTTYGVLTYRAQPIATAFTNNPGSSGGGGGASMVDDAAFTVGATEITPMGGTYRSSRDSLNDNDGGCVAITAIRGQFVTPETVAGVSLCDTTDASLKVVSPDNSISRLVSASGTNLTTAKASAGVLAGYSFTNSTASPIYLRFYDASSPTVGTTTPKLTIMIPASGGVNSPSTDVKLQFATAIKYSLTTGAADADTTGVAASDVVGFVLYR